MPYPRPEPDDGSLIVYPVDHMREVAGKILAQVGDFQAQHDLTWQQIRTFIHEDLDKTWQTVLLDCLKPYTDRLQASFDWQINLASALFDAADAIEGTDNANVQAFVPQHRGPQ